jgi:hypothetical protein
VDRQLRRTNIPPRDNFIFIFWRARGEPIGWRKHAPKDYFLFFEGVGAWFPIKFPNSSHQIPLVPINIPSKSFCSHQVLKQFPSNSSCSHQQPISILLFVIKFPKSSHQIPLRRWTVGLVRDSRRVLNGVPQFVGRHSGRPTSAGCGRAESLDFLPATFCVDRGQICFSRGSSALLPLWARPERERERERERENSGSR